MNKYHAKRTNGYASKKEAARAAELKLLERAGKIENLGEQVKFEIIPAQYDKDGKLVERAAHYVCDFAYTDAATGLEFVEDCKGFKTDVYKLKKKLMLLVHRIAIKEI